MPPQSQQYLRLDDLRRQLFWPQLLRAARLALAPRRLAIAWVVIAVTWLAWDAVEIQPPHFAGTAPSQQPELPLNFEGASQFSAFLESGPMWLGRRQELAGVGGKLDAPSPPGLRLRLDWPLGWCMAAATLVLWSLAAGAIARSAALALAGKVRLPIAGSLRDAGRQGIGLIAIALIPCGMLAVLTGVGWVLAWLIGVVVPAATSQLLLYFIVIILTLLFAAVLVLAAAVAVMLPAAVMIEWTDAMDALQRSCAYVIHGTTRFAFYALVIALQLLVLIFIADFVIELAIGHAGSLLVAAGSWTPRDGAMPAGAAFWHQALRLLIPAIAFSYLSCGGAAMYLLLRRAVDGQEPDEVWLPIRESTSQGAGVSAADADDAV